MLRFAKKGGGGGGGDSLIGISVGWTRSCEETNYSHIHTQYIQSSWSIRSPTVLAQTASLGMWEYEHLQWSKWDKNALCSHLLFKYYSIYTDFHNLILHPLLLCILFSLLLTTLTATEIQKGKHAGRGDNSEQILMKYFQIFVQNKADKLLGNQLHCFHPPRKAGTRRHTDKHKPLSIRGHMWAHSS